MSDDGLLSPVWAGAGLPDAEWAQALLDVEAALARAQARLGTIPASAAEAIGACARVERIDVGALAVAARDSGNPVVALVGRLTALVAERDPAAAECVHRGSTSQDVMDSAAMLVAARALAGAAADLRRCGAALRTLAATHRATPMAARTLTQHAVPTTFGAKAAGWLQLTLDALERLERLRPPAQLGGAGGTLAAYEQYARLAGGDPDPFALLRAFADELGLAEPLAPWHVVRTPVADIGAATAFACAALGKLGADVQVLARTEIAELSEPAAEGRGGSSAMPQKRNPVLATLLLSAARQAPAQALVLTQSLVAEDERPGGAWQAEWQPLRECLRLTVGAARAAAELAEGLEVHPERMRANLGLTGGAIVSERLVAVLAAKVGKAEAKRLLADGGFEAAAGHDLGDLLDPEDYLGAAGAVTDRVLARADQRLSAPAAPIRPAR